MESVKVWYSNTEGGTTLVRFTKGEALDDGYNGECHEGTLHYDGAKEDLDSLIQTVLCVQRLLFNEFVSHFFFKEEELREYIANAGVSLTSDGFENYREFCDICPRRIYNPKFPITATLFDGDRGLYCRLNLNPEETGKKRGWKYYFPDRDCRAPLCVGPAVISSVKEKSTYGFFMASMRQFEAPSEGEVSQFIIKNCEYYDTVSFCSNKFGSFVKLGKSILVKGESGISVCPARLDGYDHEITVSKEVNPVDLVCQTYQGCSFDDLCKRFGQFEFESSSAVTKDSFISCLFDEALSSGFIVLKSIHGVDFVEVRPRVLRTKLNSYTAEEMQEICSICFKKNAEANEAIKSKIKKGKLILDLSHRRW